MSNAFDQFDEQNAFDQFDGQEKPSGKSGESLHDKANEAILSTGLGRATAEFASAVNRGAVDLLDFFTADQVNNVLEIAGSDARIPTLGDVAEKQTTGNFMEDGIAKDAVRTAGEFVAPAAATGQVIRYGAATVPKLVNPSTSQRIMQAMASPVSKELPGAVVAGTGMELGGKAGGEIGEAIGGEAGRDAGEKVGGLVGGIGLPVAGVIIKEAGKSLVTKSAKKMLNEVAPTTQGLKEAARNVYRELDNLGVTIDSSGTARLSKQLQAVAKKEGFNARIHPKVAAALDEFSGVGGKAQTLSEVDVLRKVAKAAANSVDPDEKRLGSRLVSEIDDFLDNVGPSNLKGKGASDVSLKYRDARQLWRRVKKSEMLEEAFDKASLQASGFENGIRVQFRSILNNKKKSAGFTADELAAMRVVVKGTSMQNLAKMLGRFGFSEGQASNMLMGSAGVAGGAAIGGPAGAVAVPLIGQMSRTLAQKMTRNQAEGAHLIVKAGKSGLNVVKAYMKTVPAKERSSQDLTELLLRPDISLKSLESYANSLPASQKKLISDAVFLTTAYKSQQTSE